MRRERQPIRRTLRWTPRGKGLLATTLLGGVLAAQDATPEGKPHLVAPLLWEDQFDAAGGDDFVSEVATNGKMIFISGSSTNADGNYDFHIRAFELRSGDLVWEDRVDTGSARGELAHTIATTRDVVFAAGSTTQATIPTRSDWLVRAYDASTGSLLWEDTYDRAGLYDAATGIAASGKTVYVLGNGFEPATGFPLDMDWVLRAYDSETGALLWQADFDLEGGNDQGLDLALHRGIVIAGGFGETTHGGFDFVVRAHDAETGDLVWSDRVDGGRGDDGVLGLALGPRTVYAAGFVGGAAGPGCDLFSLTGNCDFVLRAYRLADGALLWEDRRDGTGRTDLAISVEASGGGVFTSGLLTNENGDQDFLVRAYHAREGGLVWEDRADSSGGDDTAFAIAAARGRVFVAGQLAADASCDFTPAAGACSFAVRAYHARSGQLLWEDRAPAQGRRDLARSIAASGPFVFAGGMVTGANGVADFLVRAYSPAGHGPR